MNESTETGAQVVLAGASAFIVGAFGLEPQALMYGLVGSILGVLFARPKEDHENAIKSSFFAFCVFLAATISCALVGTAVSLQWFGGSLYARNFITLLAGIVFHPALAALIQSVPGLFQWGIDQLKRRFGGQA